MAPSHKTALKMTLSLWLQNPGQKESLKTSNNVS